MATSKKIVPGGKVETNRNGLTRWGMLAALCLAAGSLASAATAEPSTGQAGGTGRKCMLQGSTLMPKDLKIYDKEAGGNHIASFTGVESKLVTYDFPKAKGGRVAVQTGTGSGSFRIDGWIDADELPLYTKAEIPAVRGHIWMGSKQQVSFVGAKNDRIKIKQTLKYPIQGTFSAWTNCTSVSLEPGTPPGWEKPGQARGYVTKKDSVDLYDSAGQDRQLVATLYNVSEEGILFWSQKARGGYIHVVHHGDIVVDAWARRRDLKRLPWGETMDQQTRRTNRSRSGPKLAVQGETKKVTATKEVALRLAPKDTTPIIGVIEKGTEVLVLDIVVGFASVLPKSLNLSPPEHFWVNAKDLGL